MPYVNTSLPALVPASGGTFTGAITAPDYVASGLTGAVAASRYVGGTASGAPGSGTFAVGDFVIAENAHIFVCTVAGSPGTWADVGSSGAPVSSVFTRTGAVVAATNDYTYAQIANSAAAVALSNLADPTTGKVVGSTANAAAAVFPPGYEISYTQITAPVNITATTEAASNAVISPGAITFDGTAVVCEFFGIVQADSAAAADIVTVSLFEGATQITELAICRSIITASVNYVTTCARYRFTPTAAAHTYTVSAFATSTTGTPKIYAGAGGTGGAPPAYVRFTKV